MLQDVGKTINKANQKLGGRPPAGQSRGEARGGA